MNSRILKIAHLLAVSISLVVGATALTQEGGNSNQQNQNSGGGNSNQRNSNAAATRRSTNGNQNGNDSMTGGGASSTTASQGNGGAQSAGGALTNSDRRFIMDLAMSGMKEVELSRLATQRASSGEVKQFAQRMVDDHTKANQELMQLAMSKGITLPAGPDAKVQSMMDKMGQATGGDFDRRYIKEAGVKEHEKAVKLLQRMAASATDADLRAFAARTLPVVQEHLTMARSLTGGMTNRSGGNMTGNANSPGARQR